MIPETIKHIDTVYLQPLGFATNCGLTQLVQTKADGTVPAIYTTNGRYKEADWSKNTTYHRVNSFSQERNEDDGVNSGLYIDRTYAMTLVCIFDRKFGGAGDSDQSAFDIYSALMNALEVNNDITLKRALAVGTVCFQAGALVTGADAWSREFSSIEYRIQGELYICAVDYSIIISGPQNCFENCPT